MQVISSPRSFSLPKRKKLTLHIALLCTSLCTISHSAVAGDLDGQNGSVSDGDIAESWSLINASTLTVLSGGETRSISSTDSTVNLDGATVTANDSGGNRNGIVLIDSQATINNSQINAIAFDATGLMLGTTVAGAGSAVTVSNSTISSTQGNGVLVGDRGILTLSNTDVTGGFNGVVLGRGTVNILDGSRIVGQTSGIDASNTDSGIADPALQAQILIDASHVEGTTGAAILVHDFGRPVLGAVDILVQNGATLTGGNGNLLEVRGVGTAANFTVDNSQLVGDVVVESTATADITLRNNASLTGQLTNVTSLAVNSGASWNMVADANVAAVSMNGGTINLSAPSSAFNTLTLGSLSGNGTFGMRVDLAATQGDFLDIGTADGNHQLAVQNTGVDPTTEGQLHMVHISGGNAQFGVVGDNVDVGTYRYVLDQRGNDWYLVGTNTITPSTESVLGLFNAAPSVWYGELTTLRNRMGELRMGGNGKGGTWARTYGQKYNVSADAGLAYSQEQYGLTAGADVPVAINDGQLLVGVLGGYSQSDLDFNAGTTGKINSYYIGTYATWLSTSGYYLDGMVKVNHFRNSANVRMSDGNGAEGRYNNYSLGGSLEFGRHIALENSWFIEPSIQLSTVWVKGKQYELDNGMVADNDSTNSRQARVGATLGKTYKQANGGITQPYVKVGVVQEFAKNNQVTVNKTAFDNDLSGTRAEIGAGIAAQVSAATQLYANLDYSKGDKIDQPWGFNVGLRYNW